MSLESNAVVLFDFAGNELAVQNGVAIPASTPGIISMGSDGTNSRYILLDSSGRQVAVGAGVAGTPAGGVLSVQGVAGGTVIPISAASLPLPTGAATEATLTGVLTTVAFEARINTLGQKTMANSTPVVIASDQTSIPVTIGSSATSTLSNVASSATNVTLLASNASRKGATIYNDSTKLLYVKLGTTASTSSFTTLLRQGDYYELPFGYTGQIDGIWSAANGAARVTELT